MMTSEPFHDGRIARALEELQELILQRFLDATFEVFERDDPDGTRLRVIVDVEDGFDVLDVVMPRLYELQVEEGLPIYVIPVQPLERVAEQLRQRGPLPPLVDPTPLLRW